MLTAPVSTSANMANPHQSGDPVGEPSGDLRSVTIEHEALGMDLRPLEGGDPAAISATYDVRNGGRQRKLDLVFVAPSVEERGTAVTLDGAGVPSHVSTESDLPPSWRPPENTPPLGGGREIDYGVTGGRVLSFTIALPPGPHRVEVRYRARPSTYSGDSPVRYWQLGYVLAPAREWAGFGGLDVTVRLPSGWRAASRPDLKRDGDALTGSFERIPADSLALTVQAPVPRAVNVVPLGWIGGLVAVVLIAALAGRWLRRRRRTSLWALPLSVLLGFGWMFLVLAALGFSSPKRGVPVGQEAWTYGYREGAGWFAISLLALLAGPIIAQVSAFVAGRISRQ